MRKRWMAFLLAVCLTAGLCAGCGDDIKDETVTAIREKTNRALELYADIEKKVEENELKAEKEFTDMKQKLTDMSEKIGAQVEETTEEDGQMAIKELDRIVENLQQVLDGVDESLKEAEQ